MLQPRLSEEIATGLSDGVAVVALESTIFSNLGLPSPASAEALDRGCRGGDRGRPRQRVTVNG